ncbi:MAG: SpoIIE family protein phosphatase [Desulfovibrio sp.]|uniref:SpoIIE family protein phosphatase n=1 Tax=Desulfovibrio sp. TaxID=885 RepID=UPI00135E0926|nr:SpoIIE family protein phosphatase [Desulfovibrio sp.]MTJ94353.1 SpoIIE family protein phosphatase [Desulfovibrio sp.]
MGNGEAGGSRSGRISRDYVRLVTIRDFEIVACSVPSAEAEENGDHWGAVEAPGGLAVVVADGAGRAPGTASQIAVSIILDNLAAGAKPLQALEVADRYLAQEDLLSTAVICLLESNLATVVAAGDSEAWGITAGVAGGQFLSHHQGRRRLGAEITPCEAIVVAIPGVLLLASDGVTRCMSMVDACDVVQQVRHRDSAAAVIEAIWRRYQDHHDDATAVVVRRAMNR